MMRSNAAAMRTVVTVAARRIARTALAAGLLTAGAAAGRAADPDCDVPRHPTAAAFRAALEQKIGATWQQVDLRTMLHKLEASSKTTAFLDRRLDPSRPRDLQLDQVPAREAYVRIAMLDGARATLVGRTIVLGPDASMLRLRTVAALRTEELAGDVPLARRTALVVPRTVCWKDLDRPRDILERIASLFKLDVEGADRVPHDLWAAAALVDVTAPEALTLVLHQFDLTFAWRRTGQAVEIVPLPESVLLERSYSPGGTLASTADAWRKQFPGIEVRVEGGKIVVRGLLESHEAIAGLGKTGPATPQPPTGGSALSKRRFTLTVKSAPAKALFERLKTSGVDVRFDEAALKAAGIDLNRRIDVSVADADAYEFFRAVCAPLGLKYRIEGASVVLSP